MRQRAIKSSALMARLKRGGIIAALATSSAAPRLDMLRTVQSTPAPLNVMTPPLAQDAESRPARERVYAHVREQILRGFYAGGSFVEEEAISSVRMWSSSVKP